MVSGQFALIIKLLSFLRIKYFCTLVLGRFMTINGSVESALRCDSIKVLDLLIHSKFNQFVGMHVKGIQLISEKMENLQRQREIFLHFKNSRCVE